MADMDMAETPALEISGLCVAYRSGGQDREVLRNVSLRIRPGETYGLVGESGCGKSTAALAVVRYLPRVGKITQGSIRVNGVDVATMGSEALRRLHADTVSMVYQDPGKALNPSMKIGPQMMETFLLEGLDAKTAAERSLAMLAKVRISDPAGVMLRYPHQLSGGMQQRVVIAMALSKNPKLLILDEPTTGLDATVEAEVLDLVAELRREFGTTILFISHNLGIVSRMCDRVGVLYAGMLVEEGPTAEIFKGARHPYTAALLRCLPRVGQSKAKDRLETIPGALPAPGATILGCAFAERCGFADARCHSEKPELIDLGGRRARCHYPERAGDVPPGADAEPVRAVEPGAPVLEIERLNKTFEAHGRQLQAVREVSLSLREGETLGLVGESGSGKSTFARLLLGLMPPDAGSVLQFEQAPLPPLLSERSGGQVKAIQMVFQNPDSALNRAHRVRSILGRALSRLGGLKGAELERRLQDLTSAVRLTERQLTMKPRQLSGGLKQRVAIARAFAGDPRVVVCDEPTSALDVSVQAAILNLLTDLQADRRVAYVFISHDLGVVRYLSDRIAVLYLGRIMEIGSADEVFEGPHHPYTEALLSAVPRVGEPAQDGRIRLEGEVPSAANPPSGCVFQTRCPRKIGALCETVEPPLRAVAGGHAMRCHIAIEQLARMQDKPVPRDAVLGGTAA